MPAVLAAGTGLTLLDYYYFFFFLGGGGGGGGRGLYFYNYNGVLPGSECFSFLAFFEDTMYASQK